MSGSRHTTDLEEYADGDGTLIARRGMSAQHSPFHSIKHRAVVSLHQPSHFRYYRKRIPFGPALPTYLAGVC